MSELALKMWMRQANKEEATSLSDKHKRDKLKGNEQQETPQFDSKNDLVLVPKKMLLQNQELQQTYA